MIINFIGNYQNGYIGEISDESHLARELERLGHQVRKINRDEWREHVKGSKEKYPSIPDDLTADITIVAKWHHFYDGSFINQARAESGGAPVFYWVWDYMEEYDPDNWNFQMAKAANLYLTGEGGLIGEYKELGVKAYYFQMDVCDGDIKTFDEKEYQEIYPVIFTGSMVEKGNRKQWLQEINKEIPVKIFSWNYKEWEKLGFDAYPAVYGEDYNNLIKQTKVVLGFSVEPHCWGYWSNRVGKVIYAGGTLLQEYAPGMELLLPNSIYYFNSPKEAVEKIKALIKAPLIKKPSWEERMQFTSQYKVKQLSTLIARYLNGGI